MEVLPPPLFSFFVFVLFFWEAGWDMDEVEIQHFGLLGTGGGRGLSGLGRKARVIFGFLSEMFGGGICSVPRSVNVMFWLGLGMGDIGIILCCCSVILSLHFTR